MLHRERTVKLWVAAAARIVDKGGDAAALSDEVCFDHARDLKHERLGVVLATMRSRRSMCNATGMGTWT